MAQHTLEERVGALEETVAGLVARTTAAKQRRDWRSTVGMFAGDPVIREAGRCGLTPSEGHVRVEDGGRLAPNGYSSCRHSLWRFTNAPGLSGGWLRSLLQQRDY
jgi:hypothetical protein